MSSLTPQDNNPTNGASGQEYWRSLNELSQTEEFRDALYREFPKGAIDLLDGTDRRDFLKVMGASLALAGIGLGGCRRWPKEEIAPFAKRPAGRIPGEPEFYASAMELGGVGSGLLVTSYDGRPIKIEGNPEHPVNRGATSLYDQASILDMYDPDRSWSPMHNQKDATWAQFDEWAGNHFAGLRASGGAGVRVLCEATGSPSMKAMKQRFMQAFRMPADQANQVWHTYEPITNDNEFFGSMMAFGTAVRAHCAYDKAKIVVSLDDDFLSCHPSAISNVRGFATSRRVRKGRDKWEMSRLYCYESQLSLTGANADERLPLRSGQIGLATAYLAGRVLNNEELIKAATVEGIGLDAAARAHLDRAAEDLTKAENNKFTVITAGARQPREVHYLVHLMNRALGNVGSTVTYTAIEDSVPHYESLKALAGAMDRGDVTTLIIIGGNPVFDAPADFKFGDLLGKVPNVIHLSYYRNETSAHKNCQWHLNRAHWLESWGDTRTVDGTYTLAQPLILPLFDGRSAIETLATIAGDDVKAGLDIVRRTFESNYPGGGDSAWRNALHDGLVRNSATTPIRAETNAGGVSAAAESLSGGAGRPSSGSYEIVFVPSPALYDGRFGNNAWLQEMPDPISKLTWDNAAIVSVAAAETLGVEPGDNLEIKVGSQTVTMPAIIVPGQCDESITVYLGYGRTFEGRICKGAGTNVYPLRNSTAMGFVTGATVSKAAGHVKLATTQDHHSIAPLSTGGKGIQKRLPTIVREATLEHYQEHPSFAKLAVEVPHRLSLFPEDKPFHDNGQYGGNYAWGMTIDLNACVGCSACVIACQAENNVPVVGKNQVLMGREMQWLRIDRYYTFHKDEKGRDDAKQLDRVAIQPMMCVHCENAPCEQVCPVAATVHDNDGLNVMVYNRCIGTRYCSNNCPYKVRRFNYFDWHRRAPHREQPGALLQVEPEYYTRPQASEGPLREMQFNPEVTVRVRGVMEKCTYCIQRIQSAKIKAKNAWVQSPDGSELRGNDRVPIADGTIKTACQQACPADAIVFGDLKDTSSRVATLHKEERAYDLLEEINTKPRTKYLAKVRNPAFARASQNGSHGGGESHG